MHDRRRRKKTKSPKRYLHREAAATREACAMAVSHLRRMQFICSCPHWWGQAQEPPDCRYTWNNIRLPLLLFLYPFDPSADCVLQNHPRHPHFPPREDLVRLRNLPICLPCPTFCIATGPVPPPYLTAVERRTWNDLQVLHVHVYTFAPRKKRERH